MDIKCGNTFEGCFIVEIPFPSSVFLEGPTKSGKTSSAVTYISKNLLKSQDEILILVPQRTIAQPYYELHDEHPALNLNIMTIGGLSRRMVELYWPMIAEDAGFKYPSHPPTLLSLETAQYFMARVVKPLLEEDFFESVTLNRNRLYSQIIDNLDKAALNGYAYSDVGERLKLAAVGDPEKTRVFQDTQFAVNSFREYCLEHNLIDLSLQMDLFMNFIWPEGTPSRKYLRDSYQHLIVDNIEETRPVTHDVIRTWMPDFESTLLIYDTDAGYRKFLGADAHSAYDLRHDCERQFVAEKSDDNIQFELIANQMGKILNRPIKGIEGQLTIEDIRQAITFESHQYYPEMLDWVAHQINSLIEDGVPPSEIVVLSPYLSDALRYSLTEKLNRYGIPWRSHRPSRSLRDEPVSEALITLSMLAHPQWGFKPARFDIAYMLVQLIDGLDLIRAQLLTEIIFQSKKDEFALGEFIQINPIMQERITYSVGERYQQLRTWIVDYIETGEEELDFFLSRIFGELLAQPGFGFHTHLAAGEITANLIDSIHSFRWLTDSEIFETDKPIGQEYIEILQDGLIAGQYLRSWQVEEESVLIAPAYTFLMRNQSVDYQFWLDIGSYGWHELIDQPLTHPYVLNRHWDPDRYWTDNDVVEAAEDNLYRLSLGLMRRCRNKIFMGLSGLGETGYEFQGMLMTAMQHVLQIANQGASNE